MVTLYYLSLAKPYSGFQPPSLDLVPDEAWTHEKFTQGFKSGSHTAACVGRLLWNTGHFLWVWVSSWVHWSLVLSDLILQPLQVLGWAHTHAALRQGTLTSSTVTLDNSQKEGLQKLVAVIWEAVV